MRRSVLAIVGLSLLAACSKPSASPIFTELQLSPLADLHITIAARSTGHVVELRRFGPTSDPIVSVFDAQNAHLASARARAGTLALALPASTAGSLSVIVRSGSATAVEHAELWVDGAIAEPDVRFSSGTSLSLPEASNALSIIGVQPPNGAPTHVALLVSADGATILQRSSGNRTRLHRHRGDSARVVFGASDVGPIRTYLNEPDQDADHDGLGDAVERQLGTCATNTDTAPGVDCAAIADPRDTDGDGLRDGWEVLGFDGGGEYLPLPSWGANPRHKDIFVEVDFRRLTRADNESHLSRRMSAQKAREMAALYADDATTDASLRASHAASMGNPDGRPGISLHLDTGIAAESAADATIYGNWGGYNPVDAVPAPDNPSVYIPQTPAVWTEQMTPSRRGIFHYVLGYTTGGGQCAEGIACGFNFEDTGNAAHEFGHTLGLHHMGPAGVHQPNCKPNYPSLMNYAGASGFSDGRALGILNNHALIETGALSPGHELLTRLETTFKYRVDQATGSVDWNRDNQFAPPGTLVRAYANFEPGGNCEFTREGEQPARMRSARSPAIVRFNGHLWVFSVTLDGKLAHTYTPGAFLCANVDDCPSFSFHPPFVHDVGPIDSVDAVTMLVGGRQIILIVGIRPDGTLFETWIEEFDGRYAWNSTATIPGSPAEGEPSLAVSHDGRRVVLAYRDRNQVLHYRFRAETQFLDEQHVTINGQRTLTSKTASPALAFAYVASPSDVTPVNSERLIGGFIYGDLRLYLFNGVGHDWTPLPIPSERMPPMASSTFTRAVGRPAIAWVPPPVHEALPANGSRPDLVTVGRLYVFYIAEGAAAPEEPKPDPVRMVMSYVDRTGRLMLGLDSYFDNMWSYAYGIDVLEPSDAGVRLAETYSIRLEHAKNQVFVRPHADGISNLAYRNFDDWKVIAWGACTTLAGVQAPPTQVNCAPRNW